MRRSIVRSIWLGLAALILSAPEPATTRAAPSSTDTYGVTPVQAVRMVVRPYYVPGYAFADCSKLSPRLYPNLTCPETARLRHWIQVRRLPMGDSGLPFCRCQSGPRTVRVWQKDANSRVAHVDAWWDFGRTSFTDTFVVVRVGPGWQVDDEYCAGRPGTSVYTRAGARHCR